MASAKQELIVRPIFFGPISIVLFVFCFAVALPLTTVPLPAGTRNNSPAPVIFLLGLAVVSGLVVAYPTVTHLNQLLRFLFSDFNLLKEKTGIPDGAFELSSELFQCETKSQIWIQLDSGVSKIGVSPNHPF